MKAEEFYDKSKHDSILDIMIDFAKYHVELALKEAYKNATINKNWGNNQEFIDEKSIINAYPLTNIK